MESVSDCIYEVGYEGVLKVRHLFPIAFDNNQEVKCYFVLLYIVSIKGYTKRN